MNRYSESEAAPRAFARRSRRSGFSLIELLIAMVVFLIVAGAAFSLFREHAPLFTQQQNLVALNFGLRNAITQMQIDVSNAGAGYFAGADIPAWPVGVAITPAPASACFNATNYTYAAGCFDTLSIVAVDTTVPPAHPSTSMGGCVLTTDTSLYATPISGTLPGYASNFSAGDQVLLINASGSQMTSAMLTAVNGSTNPVLLQHVPTNSDGTNTAANDPLGITTTANNKLGVQYCPTDWVLRIDKRGIRYYVDAATDPKNPKLMRSVNNAVPGDVIAEQIIGFKVGVSIWNNTNTDFSGQDIYTYNYVGDMSQIRSVRISLIGRTTPSSYPNYAYRNTFDKGPYEVEPVSVVINPRNLSMKDTTG